MPATAYRTTSEVIISLKKHLVNKLTVWGGESGDGRWFIPRIQPATSRDSILYSQDICGSSTLETYYSNFIAGQ